VGKDYRYKDTLTGIGRNYGLVTWPQLGASVQLISDQLEYLLLTGSLENHIRDIPVYSYVADGQCATRVLICIQK